MRKIITLIVLIALLSGVLQPLTNTFVLASEKSSSYKRGKEDGRRAGNKDTEILWSVIDFAYGFTLGPISVVHSLISSYILEDPELPDDRRSQTYNRNKDYKKGYKDGYFQVKGRNKLILRSTGWVSWIGTWAVLYQMRQ